MSEDLKWISDEMFDAELRLIAVENAQALLSVPGVYEALSEHFNNEVIRRLELKKDELVPSTEGGDEPPPEPEDDDALMRSILAAAEDMRDADHHECIKYAGKVVEGFGAHSTHSLVAKLAKCYLDLLANRTNEPVWLQVGRLKAQARARPPSKADNIDASPPPAGPAEDGKE